MGILVLVYPIWSALGPCFKVGKATALAIYGCGHSASSVSQSRSFMDKSPPKNGWFLGVAPWIGNLHQPRNIASFFETYQVSGNSGPIHHIKPYFWEYSLKFSPYIGLAYGRDLQFRLLEWPLHRGEYLLVSIHNSLLNGSLTKLITYWLVVS